MGEAPTGKALLVDATGVLQPTRLMATVRVSVGPVDEAAFCVPLVHTTESDGVACLDRVDARRKINVVRNQERLARRQCQDEALVTATFGVGSQELCDNALTCNLSSRVLFGEIGLTLIGPASQQPLR